MIPVDEELQAVLGRLLVLLFDTLEAGGVDVDGLVADGEDLGEALFFFAVGALAANVDLAAYCDGLWAW